MKVLITGATGFIGQNLCLRLKTEGHQLCALVRETSNTEFLEKENIAAYRFSGKTEDLLSFLKEEQFEGIIHLASLFLAAHKPENITELIESNVLFGTQLLEAATQAKVAWFLNTGTFWQHYQNQPYSPVNLYAATKQAFEDIAQYYIETSNLNVITLQLNDTFGPDDTRQKVFNLWKKIGKSGESLDMSPGNQIIDITFIDDVVDAYMELIDLLSKDMEKQLTGNCYALYCEQRMSLKELAEVFEETTGTKLHINWGTKEYRPREVMTPWDKGQRIPGWHPKTSLTDGIKRMYNHND